jgi:hypothetical protein
MDLNKHRIDCAENGERAGYHKRIGNAAHVSLPESEAGPFAASSATRIQG